VLFDVRLCNLPGIGFERVCALPITRSVRFADPAVGLRYGFTSNTLRDCGSRLILDEARDD
jgi:hypothetical protein